MRRRAHPNAVPRGAPWLRPTLAALAEVETGRAADRVLGSIFRNERVSPEHRASVARLVDAVQRARAQLDWWLERLVAPINPRTRVIAALALIEELDLNAITWAFNDVRLAPEEQKLARRLAERVLTHSAQPRAVRLNIPAWAEPLLDARFGEVAEAEILALTRTAGLDLRANALLAERDAVRHALAAQDVQAEPTAHSPWGLRVAGRPPIARTRAYTDGWVEVQDEGSQIASLLVEAAPGMRVLDLCSGAGGKTLALAAAMQNKGRIVACDVHDGRIADAATRLRRAQVHNVSSRVVAAERDPWLARHKAGFDRVLVDAPCSGTGTWRRNPDARWQLGPERLADLIRVQAALLADAAALVRPGGRLVYVTCSVLACENDDQVTALLAARPELSLMDIRAAWPRLMASPCPADGPTLQLSPRRSGTDGMFVAVLERAVA
ncbi:RsmB/NOP family class I SAM-dependent RNA methyltransferase [Zavarzinia sp. CC-PAN008]|uniref:RsmB/NOP family class I SAM-dependent RNA methyltransferase n=1 Tax=Zavarzinia sp. CC-PAN008 TaxID=3243332 RepID=UPI003F749DEF